MATERTRYQRLPGRRRGIMRGSSVWLAPDHLLLVRSWRVREEYKRFHMGDIQSIAVAAAPRFHISTRSLGIGLLWCIALAIAWSRGTWAPTAVFAAGAALVIAWVYISARCSCVCRIYTAVSADDLPSIYRTWTAKKFVGRVEPHIAAAQGAMESGWEEQVDARRIGPPEHAPDLQGAGANGTSSDIRANDRGSAPISEIFTALMFVDALFSFATRHTTSAWHMWLGYGILAIEMALSVTLLIRHYRGNLQAGMQKLVIAVILVTGMTWYSNPIVNAIATVTAPGLKKPPVAVPAGLANDAVQDIDIGAHLLWGLIGAVIILTGHEKRPRGIIG